MQKNLSMVPIFVYIDIYLKIHNEFYFWNVICRFVRGWTKMLPNVLMKYVLLLLINFPPQLRWQVDIWGISLGFVYSQCIQQWLLHLLCFTSNDARRCWEHSHANSLLTLILAPISLQRVVVAVEKFYIIHFELFAPFNTQDMCLYVSTDWFN